MLISQEQIRRRTPAWLIAALLPAPAILSARSGSVGLMYFFAACMGLVAYVFGCELCGEHAGRQPTGTMWRELYRSTAINLLAAWSAFAVMCLPLDWPHNIVAAGLGLLLIIPSLCVAPTILLATRQPFATVVFSLTLVGMMKLLGCVVVVLTYGWDASEHGHTTMPWLAPNLLVWMFYALTAVLSAGCFLYGLRRVHAASAAVAPGVEI